LKDATTKLDSSGGRGMSPVQQARNYAFDCPECSFFLVSNYRETRLYHKGRGLRDYERFAVEDLESEEGFGRFLALLHRDVLLPADGSPQSDADRLLRDSLAVEQEITADFYKKYRDLREAVLEAVQSARPSRTLDRVIEIEQRILDRVLVIAFAEDRGLLPKGTLAEAARRRDRFHPRPRWDKFRVLFRWIDEGNRDENVPDYNGGLFRREPELDELSLPDKLAERLGALADYDCQDEVSVLVLGHIFENSIEDLERLRRRMGGAANGVGEAADRDKRHREGVFYTPEFVTRHIADAALGRVIGERRAAWFADAPAPLSLLPDRLHSGPPCPASPRPSCGPPPWSTPSSVPTRCWARAPRRRPSTCPRTTARASSPRICSGIVTTSWSSTRATRRRAARFNCGSSRPSSRDSPKRTASSSA
jgi:hypothetical protein